MLNIKELEKRWLWYKIRYYTPFIIIFFLCIAIGLTFFILQKTKTTPSPQKKLIIKEKKKETPSPIQQNKTILLEPSLDFMKKIQNNRSHKNLPNNSQKSKKQITPAHTLKKQDTITIKRHSTKDDLTTIIQRFQKNNNPTLSLFIANKYYKLGNYYQSYNYALITNNLDNEIEASWILFSKSLVKLGKKKMAIKTLKTYIRNSHSSNAKSLLQEILSGKFQ